MKFKGFRLRAKGFYALGFGAWGLGVRFSD